ncbi:MAG: ABC transporter substrate-binding protein [Chloroflexi bacterium]|nr:ABC transporter substrate-binding protein [Chloroflexota bacterium]
MLTNIGWRQGAGQTLRRAMSGASLLAVSALVLAMAACAPSAQQGGQPAGGAGQPAAEAQPKRGGGLNLPLNADPIHLDSHQAQSFAVAAWDGLVHSRLLGWKVGPDVAPEDIILEGDLAEKWEISSDATTYTFRLRKGVKWHNIAPVSGRELTAADVKYTMERSKDCKVSFYCQFVGAVSKIETPDNYTVTVTLKEPVVAFPYFMSSVNFPIVAKEVAEQEDGLKRRAVGTGPYSFDKWERASQVVVKRNPDYYDKGVAHLDEITWFIMPDIATRLAAFLSKQIDYFAPADDKELATVTDRIKDVQVKEVLGRSSSHLYFRVDKAPWNNLKVRQAVNLALDRKDYLKTLHNDKARMGAPIPAGYGRWSLPYDELTKHPMYQYDPVKAKQLLTEAGYPNGFNITMDTTPAHGQGARDKAEYIEQAWKKVGVGTKHYATEYAKFLLYYQTGDMEDIMTGGQVSFTDPEELLLWLQGSFKAAAHDPGFDPKLDELIKKQRSTINEAERIKIIHEIQRHIIDQAYYVTTVTGVAFNAWHSYVKNFYPHSYAILGWGSARLAKVWVDK